MVLQICMCWQPAQSRNNGVLLILLRGLCCTKYSLMEVLKPIKYKLTCKISKCSNNNVALRQEIWIISHIVKICEIWKQNWKTLSNVTQNVTKLLKTKTYLPGCFAFLAFPGTSEAKSDEVAWSKSPSDFIKAVVASLIGMLKTLWSSLTLSYMVHIQEGAAISIRKIDYKSV